jgi:hypothetical protein
MGNGLLIALGALACPIGMAAMGGAAWLWAKARGRDDAKPDTPERFSSPTERLHA